MNTAVVHVCVRVSIHDPAFCHFGSVPGGGIAGSYGVSMLNLLGSCFYF